MIVNNFISYILKKRFWIITSILAITIFFSFFLHNLKFDNSIESWFLENDPQINDYQSFLNRFQADEIAVMGVFADDVFNPSVLKTIDRMTLAAQKAPYAYRVTSLTNIKVPQLKGDVLEIGLLVKKIPKNKKDSELLKQQAENNDIIKGILSPDGKATAIVIEMDHKGNDFKGKSQLVKALQDIAKKEAKEIKVLITGTPSIDHAFYSYTKKDMTKLVPIVALVILVLLVVFFKKLLFAFIPFGVVILSCVWLLGLMVILKKEANVLTSAILAVVLAVGVADAIHLLTDYYQQCAEAKANKLNAIIISFKKLFKPCLLTTITTMGGMLALFVSDLRPVREFGLLAAVGVGFAFLLSMSLIPILLFYAKKPEKEFIDDWHNSFTGRFLNVISVSGKKTQRFILVISVFLTLGSLLLMPSLKVGANVFNYFRDSDSIKIETNKIENKLGGTAAVEFVIKTKEEGLYDPKLLTKIDLFEEWLRQLKGVSFVVSVADEIKELNHVFHGQKNIPKTRAEVAEFMFLLESENNFDSFVQDNLSVARISVRARFEEADQLTILIPQIQDKLKETFKKPETALFTGFVKLMRDMERYLVTSQIKSFSLAFVVIMMMMGLLFSSVKMAIWSMIPNILPIIWGLGFMSFFNITLDPGTVMIASIAIGLVVDDTMHMMVGINRNIKKKKSVSEAVKLTVADSGRPIIITSLVLSLAFLVMLLGSFMPNIHFGIITSFVILMALMADLLLLPIVVKISDLLN